MDLKVGKGRGSKCTIYTPAVVYRKPYAVHKCLNLKEEIYD